jgi:hypothetical protein
MENEERGPIVPWKDELFQERSLWDIWRRSPSLSSSRFNTQVVAVCFMVFFISAVVSWSKWDGNSKTLLASLEAWSSMGFIFASTLLGFLVAGFAIFATISKPALFVDLAQFNYPGSRLTALKYIFFSFVNIFVHYMSFLILAVTVRVLFWNEWPGSIWGKVLAEDAPEVFVAVAHVFLVLLATWLIILLIKLKSFIWNVYQAVLLSIAHEAERSNGRERQCASEERED